MVQHPIEDSGGEDAIAEDLTPGAEALVGVEDIHPGNAGRSVGNTGTAKNAVIKGNNVSSPLRVSRLNECVLLV